MQLARRLLYPSTVLIRVKTEYRERRLEMKTKKMKFRNLELIYILLVPTLTVAIRTKVFTARPGSDEHEKILPLFFVQIVPGPRDGYQHVIQLLSGIWTGSPFVFCSAQRPGSARRLRPRRGPPTKGLPVSDLLCGTC
jgi:hypothetical protein